MDKPIKAGVALLCVLAVCAAFALYSHGALALSLPRADLQDPLAGGSPENLKYNLATGLIGLAALTSIFISVVVYLYKRQKKKG